MEYNVESIQAIIRYEGKSETIIENNVKVVITKPRNLKHHNKVMAMFGYTHIHMKPRAGIDTPKKLILAYKDFSGMFDVIPRKDGTEMRDYHSISFASMDEVGFKMVSESMRHFCCLVLGDRPVEVTDKLMEYM